MLLRRRLLLRRPPSPNDPGGLRPLFRRPKEKERRTASPLSFPRAACASIRALSFRVVAILRPSSILRPRTPLLFPPLFSLPTSRQRAPRTRYSVFPSSSSSVKYRRFPNRHRSYRATRPSRYRSRTDSSLQPFARAISHPVRTDLHRATEDRIEALLKREGEKR